MLRHFSAGKRPTHAHPQVPWDAAGGHPRLAVIISVLSGCTDWFIISLKGICERHLIDAEPSLFIRVSYANAIFYQILRLCCTWRKNIRLGVVLYSLEMQLTPWCSYVRYAQCNTKALYNEPSSSSSSLNINTWIVLWLECVRVMKERFPQGRRRTDVQ